MLTDPQTITYATVAKNLPAISRGTDSSEYKLNDNGTIYDLLVGHAFKARNRVFTRLRRDVYAADPIVPAQNILASATCSLTMDFPTVGMTQTDVQNLAKALVGYLVDATLLKLITGET